MLFNRFYINNNNNNNNNNNKLTFKHAQKQARAAAIDTQNNPQRTKLIVWYLDPAFGRSKLSLFAVLLALLLSQFMVLPNYGL